jgi:hypothetical protein
MSQRWNKSWFVLNTLFMHSFLREEHSDEISHESPPASTHSYISNHSLSTHAPYHKHKHHPRSHLKILKIIGLGSPIETVFLLSMILFGIALFVIVTVGFVQEIV